MQIEDLQVKFVCFTCKKDYYESNKWIAFEWISLGEVIKHLSKNKQHDVQAFADGYV